MLNNNRFKSTFTKIKNTKIHYILKKKKSNGASFSIVFLCGYKSDVFGKKAVYIEKLQEKMGFEYLRFDYSGHGFSEGKIESRTLTNWLDESLNLINRKTKYPLILIGSSMGGWLSLVLGKKLTGKLAGIIGIATAPDFTSNILKNLSKKKLNQYKKDKYIKLKSEYDKNGYTFSEKFIKDSEKYFVLKQKIYLKSKIIFLYGKNDKSVNFSSQIKLIELINCKETSLIISEKSDHRMSSQSDLLLLKENIIKLLNIKK
tara:strand:- start:172 stop:948 length:777 start_codon:yes stop_codon:yes gene_type:complete